MTILKQTTLLNGADTAKNTGSFKNSHGYGAIVAVDGTFTGLKLAIEGKVGTEWYALAATDVATRISTDEIENKGAFEVMIGGFSEVRAYVTAISSGSVTVDAVVYDIFA